MRRRFFLSSFARTLANCLLPLVLLCTVYLAISIPEQRRDVHEQALNNLTLMKENIALLLNDTSKVMNLMENSGNTFTIRRLFQQRKMNYGDYLSYKNLATQLAAIVNSRTYVDSIYITFENSGGTYLTSHGRLYTHDNTPDPDWMETCVGQDTFRLVRRSVRLTSLPQATDYLTIVEKNERGYIVAVNINVSYFRRIFSSLALKDEQVLMIVDESNLLLASQDAALPLFNSLGNPAARETIYMSNGQLVVHSHFEALGLEFISTIPQEIAYSTSNRFVAMFLGMAVVCMALSFVSAIISASRTSKRLYSILDLMDAASHHRPLPTVSNPRNDVYGYIMTNIIKTFVQNDYLRVSLDERKFQAISLELSALQYQINPHFLSNTLQIIDFEVLRAVGKPHRANRMIEQLSAFLQYSLKSPNEDVNINQEVEATKLYASLMQARFSNLIELEWFVSPDTLALSIPKLILQPMIENSIQHGREGCVSTLHICISITLQENMLHVSVRDDGPGVAADKLAEVRASLMSFTGFNERHIGLPNLFRRLQLRYGDGCRAEIHSAPGEGFEVCLFIPVP